VGRVPERMERVGDIKTEVEEGVERRGGGEGIRMDG
jgi:hypothetical protein